MTTLTPENLKKKAELAESYIEHLQSLLRERDIDAALYYSVEIKRLLRTIQGK